jgi:hypothetical protein
MGAEEDDLIGIESLGHSPGEATDDSQRNVGSPIVAPRQWSLLKCPSLGVHTTILEYEALSIQRRE